MLWKGVNALVGSFIKQVASGDEVNSCSVKWVVSQMKHEDLWFLKWCAFD